MRTGSSRRMHVTTVMPLALLAVVAARAAVTADMALQAAAAGSTLDIRDCGAVAGSLAHNLSIESAMRPRFRTAWLTPRVETLCWCQLG